MKSRIIPFTKATACGNDFLIVEAPNFHADLKGLSREMCDRHLGIGADGVEWLYPDSHANIRARLFNADGSEAEISGNGTRCVAAYICSEKHKEKIVVRTEAGLKTCKLVSQDQTEYEFEIAMGKPQVEKEFTVSLASGNVSGIPVSVGNPHYVVFVDKVEPGWQQKADDIGRDPRFPQGVNVEIVTVKSKSEIDVKFFERGVGETQSSGTGSCAAAVAAIATRNIESQVRVIAQGGTQTVKWLDEVFLTGTAKLICRGEYLLKKSVMP